MVEEYCKEKHNWFYQYFLKQTQENTMANKFVAFIPGSGEEGTFARRPPRAKDFYTVDEAKVWAGRQMLADPKLDEVFIYRLDSKVRLNKLLADHTEIVDLR
jgi:hypothetical protein